MSTGLIASNPSKSATEITGRVAKTSVVVPVFDEEESIPAMHAELYGCLKKWGRPFEILYVDDGSTDATPRMLDELAAQFPEIVVIHFRRNHGQTAAMSAGIDHATGEIIVPIDADLQNDPADIPALVATLETGYDVVSGWRRDRQDKAISRRLPSKLANWLISKISGVKLQDYGCTLKAYRREVMEGVRLYGEMHRFIPIYAHMQGGRVTEQVVNHRARKFGKSKYGLVRIFKVMLDLMFVKFMASYSVTPIYVFGGVGLFCLALSMIPAGLAVFFKFASKESGLQKDFISTPLPIVSAVLVLVGILAILQGLLAEMLMRTYFESQGKKAYLVRKIVRHEGAPHTGAS